MARCIAYTKWGERCASEATLERKCIPHFSEGLRKSASLGWKKVLKRFKDPQYARTVLTYHLRATGDHSKFVTLLTREQFVEANKMIDEIIRMNGLAVELEMR